MSLSSLGIIVVLFSITMVALVYLVDINRHKDKIARLLKKHTGRAFQFQDRIHFTVLPWAGLNLGKVRIGNARGFDGTDFIDIHAVKVRVKVMPLFAKRVVVDTVRLDGMDVNLMRNADGVTNWDDLLELAQQFVVPAAAPAETPAAAPAEASSEASAETPAAASGETPAAAAPAKTPVIENKKLKQRLQTVMLDQLPGALDNLKILGLDIKGLNLIFDDHVSQAVFKLTNLEMKTSEVSLNHPFQVQLNTTASARNLKAMDGLAFDSEMEVETKVTMRIEKSIQTGSLPAQ